MSDADVKPKHPGGRPTDYCFEVVEEVCEKIATYPYGYKRLHKEFPHLPSQQTILTWIGKYPEFLGRYLQAKSVQMHLLMDNTIDIACRDETDEEENIQDTMVKINRDKLKIDTFKYVAAKLEPKVYGDKKEIKDDNASLLGDIIGKLAK